MGFLKRFWLPILIVGGVVVFVFQRWRKKKVDSVTGKRI